MKNNIFVYIILIYHVLMLGTILVILDALQYQNAKDASSFLMFVDIILFVIISLHRESTLEKYFNRKEKIYY